MKVKGEDFFFLFIKNVFKSSVECLFIYFLRSVSILRPQYELEF